MCPGSIGSLAKYSIDLQGFSFFSMLRCIFDSNVKHYVFKRFSSVFPQSMYIYCTEYPKMYAAECQWSLSSSVFFVFLKRLICKCFPRYPPHSQIIFYETDQNQNPFTDFFFCWRQFDKHSLRLNTNHTSVLLFQFKFIQKWCLKRITKASYSETSISRCRASRILIEKGSIYTCIAFFCFIFIFVLFHRKTLSCPTSKQNEIVEMVIMSNMKDFNLVPCHQSRLAVILLFLSCTFGQYSPSPTRSTCSQGCW